jgi:hypothetical protein
MYGQTESNALSGDFAAGIQLKKELTNAELRIKILN